jgi:hypothetical protein
MAHWVRRATRWLWGRPARPEGLPSAGAWERARFEQQGPFVNPRVRPPGPFYEPPPEPPEEPERPAADRGRGPRHPA